MLYQLMRGKLIIIIKDVIGVPKTMRYKGHCNLVVNAQHSNTRGNLKDYIRLQLC